MLNWIFNPRLDIRSKLRIAYDLLYVRTVYRVRKPAFLPVACGAMFRLNRYARQAHRLDAHPIYDLKNRFVRMLYEFGYCQSVTQQKQILECWPCWGTGKEYEPLGGLFVYLRKVRRNRYLSHGHLVPFHFQRHGHALDLASTARLGGLAGRRNRRGPRAIPSPGRR